METLDSMYYRNQATIANQIKCSNYKSLRTYSSCSEDKVQSTVPVAREVEKPATVATPGK
jgi:hypothetical protein